MIGHVTLAALVRAGFAEAEVRDLHEAACARAAALCAGAPFAVEGV